MSGRGRAVFGSFPLASLLDSSPWETEPHIYLNAVLRDFQIAGGKIVVREFASREDVLGGTFERDVWSLEPNQSEIQRILEGHAKIFRALKRA